MYTIVEYEFNVCMYKYLLVYKYLLYIKYIDISI